MSKLKHDEAATRLKAAGITWSSSGGGSDRNDKHSTSFEQINSGTIDGIITLKNASGCAINITGGTEVGHSGGTYSHWNGYKLDITPSDAISHYITKHFAHVGKRADGAEMYKSKAGNIYARESNHWDITYF
jgi:hypothetical protein